MNGEIIKIKPYTPSQAAELMKGLKGKIETIHNVSSYVTYMFSMRKEDFTLTKHAEKLAKKYAKMNQFDLIVNSHYTCWQSGKRYEQMNFTLKHI